ncbi:TPA: hypothetical protein ACOEQU_004205 [Stenotrophomonas maltophilia]
MLFEYAVEPKVIGSNWQTFRYLIEKFGFDRGRLISKFPKTWEKEVLEAAVDFSTMDRARLVESLQRAKQSKFLRSGRPFDRSQGWMANALTQQDLTPFRAIVAQENTTGHTSVVVASALDELEPLMESPHTWQVPRTGADLAVAMRPLLISARTILFVDPYFDVLKTSYRQTLQACLSLVQSSGTKEARCEIHFCPDKYQLEFEELERCATASLRGVVPPGMSVCLYAWSEKFRGEDFHARNLLTDVGGVNVESGFSAVGPHQRVQIGLLATDYAQRQLVAFARTSNVYDLQHPVLEISADGTARRI